MRFISLIVFLALLSSATTAKDFTIDQVEILTEILDDGTIQYTEHRTYTFDGDFSMAYYTLPLAEVDSVTHFEVLEGNEPYLWKEREEPGYFSLYQEENSARIEWFYNAEDETRTFTIRYVLHGALAAGPQHSEFMWNYVHGPAWDKTTEAVHISVFFPQEITENDIHIWNRGIADQFAVSYQDSAIVFQGGPITRREYFENRIIFPTGWVPDINVNKPDFSLGLAQTQEQQRLAEIAMAEIRAERNRQLAVYASYVIFIISLLLALFALQRYRPHRDRKLREEFIYEPPAEHPILIDWMYNSCYTTDYGRLAGIFNLARLGYFNIRETEDKNELTGEPEFIIEPGKNTDVESLPDWDRSLLTYIKRNIDNGTPKITDQFSFQKTWQWEWDASWKKIIKNAGKARQWYTHENNKAMITMLLLQTVLIICSIFALVYSIMGVLPLAMSVIGFLGSLGIVHLTDKGYELKQYVKAYQRALKKESPDKFDRDKLPLHFIYSIMFGLSEKVLKKHLADVQSSELYWIILTNSSIHNLGGFSNAISSITANSSGSFSGGGVSVGAAGGGAGGGAR